MENQTKFEQAATLFLKKAQADYRVADILLKNKEYPDSAYHFQQAVEKSIKALFYLLGDVIEEHKLSTIIQEKFEFSQERWQEIFGKIAQYTFDLEKDWIKPRYPFIKDNYVWDPQKGYNKTKVEKSKSKAKYVIDNIMKYAKEELDFDFNQ